MATIRIWLNATLFGQTGEGSNEGFTLASTYESDSEDPLEEAYERFNVGEDNIARAYRAEGHRSLSVGDNVQVDDTIYRCSSFGWKQLGV